MYIWPDYFPAPDVTFGGNAQSSVTRTKMDAGTFRQRQRFTTGTRTYSATWTLTDEQWDIFQAVLAYELSNGADWFTIALPIGEGLTTCTARFVNGNYSHTHTGVLYWKVTAALEINSLSTLTEDDYQFLVDNDYDFSVVPALEAAGDAFHILVNETLPTDLGN